MHQFLHFFTDRMDGAVAYACVTLFDKNIRFPVYDETEIHVEELYYTHDMFKNTNALCLAESFRRQYALHAYASYGQSGRQERIERGRNEAVADSSANIRILR